MTKYAIAETAVGAVITSWSDCRATTEAAAKRIAQISRTFQGTEAHVGLRLSDGSVSRLATRRPAGVARPGWAA